MLTKVRIAKLVEGDGYALHYKAGNWFSGDKLISAAERRQLNDALEAIRVKQYIEKYGGESDD